MTGLDTREYPLSVVDVLRDPARLVALAQSQRVGGEGLATKLGAGACTIADHDARGVHPESRGAAHFVARILIGATIPARSLGS
jgi:hypothetical protein